MATNLEPPRTARGAYQRRPVASKPAPAPSAPWASDAACLNQDTEKFYALGGVTGWHESNPQKMEALAVCARCPVREDCLEWAIEQREDYGIWGGLDEVERRKMRRQRERAARQP